MTTKMIPIVFSCDDFYLPFLSVALASLEENASKDYEYDIKVIHSKSISEINQINIVKQFNKGIYHLSFVDISDYVAKINEKLHTRDYYTKSTYYRLFIPNLFPNYDKVLYLDSDIVVLGDISKLYNTQLGDNLVGAIVEDVMVNVDVFGTYVEKALGINRYRYFNAGILLMNTKKFREEKIEEQFFNLLFNFCFYVTQDEDYLNVLCKDRVVFINEGWNRAPIPGTELALSDLFLIHYKMAWKPWKYNEVLYGDIFWKYAYNTVYFDTLLEMKKINSDPKVKENDDKVLQVLIDYAVRDSNDPNNYHQTMLKQK